MLSNSVPVKADEMKKVVRLYYGFQFFFSLLIWLPIFYAYQKAIGLNDDQIFRIQSFYYVAFCLLEIPTGLAADRFGYRLCLRLGALTVAVANLLPIFAQNYNGFLIHFMLIALARSLISGASSAYLYDYLQAQGAAAHYKVIEGRARAYGLAGKVVFWSAVGFLMEWRLTAPYWATFIATAISV
ncbi:MAG: MFS transporter, partial [Proteobacteria bacterium]